MRLKRVEIPVDDSDAAQRIADTASFNIVVITRSEMKKFRNALILSLILFGASLQSGCYGSFGLTGALYSWNGSIEDKYVRSIVMFALGVVQVYTAAALIDAAILNVIEFWTGSNPISMKQGEKEQQWITYKGKTYLMEASRNRFRIIPFGKSDAQKPVNLVFTPFNTTWNLEQDGKLIALSRIEEYNGSMVVRVFGKDGSSQVHSWSGEGNMAALRYALEMGGTTASR